MKSNKHIAHIEDAILIDGIKGVERSLQFFWKLLIGQLTLTTKIDGSPAIVFGCDPLDNQFFVSTKSFFNKTPLLYKTEEDLWLIEDESLRQKLRVCLQYLEEICPTTGYYQADFLFTLDDLFWVEAKKCFQPNVLQYGLDYSYLKDTKVGVCIHTCYDEKGDMSFDNIPRQSTQNVFVLDNRAHFYYDKMNLSPVFEQFRRLDKKWLDRFMEHPELSSLVLKFFNNKIREGETISHPRYDYEIKQYITQYYIEKIGSMKSPVGKARQQKLLDNVVEIFKNDPNYGFNALLHFMNKMKVLKLKCINSISNNTPMSVWVEFKDGRFKSTQHEGYVLSDGSDVYKLVDREQFSYYNFSPDILRGWDKPNIRN